MRVLLSTIGSRGDVQPMLALALALRAHGAEARLCAPPDFAGLAAAHALPFVPIGPEVRHTAQAPKPAAPPTPEQMLVLAQAAVATQFATITAAAEDCDVLLGCGALQIALHSIAALRGARYVFACYCPITLPSPQHAPPVWLGDGARDASVSNSELWAADAARWNASWGQALNAERSARGLAPVDDVRDHIFSEQPWLAADATLAPWPDAGEGSVLQTGAWIAPDTRALPPAVERFLDAGDAPIYLGFGSVRAPQALAAAAIGAARALGRRIIVQRGWAELDVAASGADVLAVDEINQQALFARVALAMHHGGAGTTTVAARAGAPQLIAPQVYDQHYFAHRVSALGLGGAYTDAVQGEQSLTDAFARALAPEVATRARDVGRAIRGDGAKIAARLLASP